MYELCRIIFNMIFTVFFRWEIKGAENIPKTGGLIIAANHVSNFDPPVIGCALSRKLHFMAKEELFVNQVLRWAFIKLGSFPVKRASADRVAIRKAMSLLEEGEVLGIFPEGTRSKTGALGRAEPGLAMIALKTGVPIVPTAVMGTNQVFKGTLFPRFKVIFGEPIYIEKGRADKQSMEDVGKHVMENIANLIDRG